MNPHYAFVAERANHRCEYCRAPEVIFNFPFEVEHVVPPGLGGPTQTMNQALACRSCNLYKSNHILGLDDETGTMVPLFQPRVDDWSEHFELVKKDGMITGKTSSGSATVLLLRMNTAKQCAARKTWGSLGLYP